MNIALVPPDGPLANLSQLSAPILDTGIVTRLFHHCPKLKILRLTFASNQKLVVLEWLIPFGYSHNNSILDRPDVGVAIPARKIFAVEQTPLLSSEQ